jgi:Flp pilus assembly protein TadG
MAAQLAFDTAKFRRDQKGGVAIIFGLSAMVMTMIAGFAIDYSRVTHEHARVSAAIDAAALAAGKALLDGRLSDDDVKATAQAYYEKNIEGKGRGFGVLETFEVQIDRAASGVTVEATVKVDMTLARIAGFDSMEIPLRASTKLDQQDIELSLALDVTGSMGSPGKIDALRRASTKLVEIMLPDEGTPNKVRVALAPYSSGVNAGMYAAAATGTGVSNCTFEREGGDIAGNETPAVGAYLKTVGSPGIVARATCPVANVVALTDRKATLLDEIARYEAQGSTAGHLGALWAWYMLSDTWSSVFTGNEPAPYHDGKTKKALVLMTDGLFNTIGGGNGGDDSPTATRSQRTAVEACDSMRDRDGIMVYTVGFKLDEIRDNRLRERAEQTLRDCSGNDTSRHFDATNEAGLIAAFESIAQQLNNLRLTN